MAADVGKYLRATISYTDPQGSGKSARATTAQIEANNAEPSFSAETATRTLPENSGAGTNVGTAVMATDSDTSDTLHYSINGTDASSFTIDSGTGQIKTKSGVSYDFEATKNSYSLTVNVRDSKDAAGDSDTAIDDSITVTISVTDINETPTFPPTAPTSVSFAENTAITTAVATFAASDVDASTTLTWSVETDTEDGGKFDINSSTGVLTFKASPDFEMPDQAGGTDNLYNVTVRVTDNGSPALSTTHSIAVTVTNVNEAPTIDSGPSSVAVDENIAAGTIIATFEASDVDANSDLTWVLEGEDAGDFTITKNPVTGEGELKFAGVPDFEMPTDDDDADSVDPDNVYDVTVVATDNHTPQGRAELDVSVAVNDLNERPIISGNEGHTFDEIEFDVSEADLTAADYRLGAYTAYDDDVDTVAWDLSGTDAGHFTIGENTGVLSFSIRPDFENPHDDGSNNEYEVVIEADDGQGESNSVGTLAVKVTVTPVNETPEITTAGASHATPMFAEIEYDATTAVLTVADYDGRDEEGETITWSLGGDDMSDFTIDSTTGVLTFNGRPDFEDPKGTPATTGDDPDNTYEIVVMARDTNSNAREFPVVVTVTDVDEPPEFTNPPADRTFVEIEYDANVQLVDIDAVARFTARDEEMRDLGWDLSGADAGDFEIARIVDTMDGLVTFAALPNFEISTGSGATSNIYEFTVEVSDPAGNTASHDYVVTVTDVNEQPKFTGTPASAVTYDENDTGDVASYVAYDEEGGVDWSLTGTDAGEFNIDSGGTVSFVKSPNWEGPDDADNNNIYEFNVVATDVASDPPRRRVMQDVTVTVLDVEEPRVIIVSNLDPAVGQEVRFELSEPDGGVPTSPGEITWSLQGQDDMGVWQPLSITSPNATVLNYTVQEEDTGKPLRAEVNYFDRRSPDRTLGSRKSLTSQATAAVLPDPAANVSPRFTAAGTMDIPESPAGVDVGDPVTASDRDNDTLTFGIEGGTAEPFFEIDASTGQLSTTQMLDFESLSSEPLLLEVSVHDGRTVDEDNEVISDSSVDAITTIRINVTDVEEDATITLSDEEPAVDTTVQATLTDGDGEISGQSWQWARSPNGTTNWINIASATSSSYTTTQADAEFFLRVRVNYTDRRGGGKSAEAVTAQRVVGENQRPTFTPVEDGQRTIPESTGPGVSIGAPVAAEDPEGDTLTYSLSGADAAAFSIHNGTGQLRTSGALDYESKSSYNLTVEVHDGKDGLSNPSTTVDDTQSVAITIGNVEEPGVVTLTTLTENFQARVEITALLSDPDGVSSVSWQWSRSPDGRTNWVNIAGATSSTHTPTLEEDQGNYLRATASYSDGHGPNKTAQAVSSRVGDPPPVNSAPAFPSTDDGRREVREDVAGGALIGDPIAANDVNDDALTYSISGADAASFDIDSGTGQLRLADNVQLDFETKRSYRVIVSVTDGNDEFDDPDGNAIDDTINVAIAVVDVNEPPLVTGETAPSFQENGNASVATYSAADPERGTLSWSVSDTETFWISDRGQLHFVVPPSFEGGSTTHNVVVTATDQENLAGSLNVAVSVTDVEEEGVVSLSPPRGWVDAETLFTATLHDDDGSISGESWQWAGSTNRSTWTDIAGATSSTYTVSAGDIGQHDPYLRATVSYTDRRGSNKTASGDLPGRIDELVPATNAAPEFADDHAARSISQGTASGRAIGAPVRASDPDSGEVLTYALSGEDADKFDIDAATGQLLTKTVLDLRERRLYSVTMTVHDGFDLTYEPSSAVDDSIQVTITVTEPPTPPQVPRPVNSQPEQSTPSTTNTGTNGGGGSGGGRAFVPAIAGPRFTDGTTTSRPLPVIACPGDPVGEPVVAVHPNNSRLTYSLGGQDTAIFDVVDYTGQINLGRKVELELAQSYAVNLTATDGSGRSGTIAVAIEVVESPTRNYDLNGNCIIEKIEVIRAVSDYFAELMDKEDVMALVSRYFAG